MFELTKGFPDKLILGLEIRDKVVNFAGEKVNAKRINEDECLNVGVLRTNAMKSLHNYFKKDSVRTIVTLLLTHIILFSSTNYSSALPIPTSRR